MEITPGVGIHTRNPSGQRVPDSESQFNQQWFSNHFDRVVKTLAGITRYLEDKTRPVDEYQPTPNSTELQSVVTVLPQFDAQISERITSVMVWGAPNATGTLQLGDCVMSITIPSTGIIVLGPLGLLLSNSDKRVLTLSPAGNIGLRLMGWADVRY